MNHLPVGLVDDIPQSQFTFYDGKPLFPNLNISHTDLECKTPDYVLQFFPILPLTIFHIDISPDTWPTLIIIILVIFISSFFHQVLRAYREFLLWKTYSNRGYRCIPILSESSATGAPRPQQVALVPMPSYAACIAKWNQSNRVHPLEDTPPINQKVEKKTPAYWKALQRSATNKRFPVESSAEMASGARDLVNRTQTSAQAAADLVAVSSMARNIQVPAYCVRTRGGFVGCTSSPYTLTTHGRPEIFSMGYFMYSLIAFLEACLAVVVVSGIATFNGWMGVAAVVGGALGHCLTHWQAVTVVEVKES